MFETILNLFKSNENGNNDKNDLITFDHLKLKPFPYQKEGIQFIEDRRGVAGLGDEQGLGKTLQIIGYTSFHRLRTLVICPAYLKYNWKQEIEQSVDRSVLIYNSKNPPTPDQLRSVDYVIINYAIVHKFYQDLINAEFECVACDECQYLTNPKSKRTKYASQVISTIPKRIMSSGTPIRNNEKEFFVPLALLRPDIHDFQSFRTYSTKYCRKEKITLKNANQEIDFDFNTLKHKLSLFYIRRLKKNVLPELPPKIKSNFPLELSEPEFQKYSRIMNDNIKDGGILSAITRTKQYLSELKIKKVIPFIEDIVSHGEKVIVYSQYVNTLEKLSEHFPSNSILHYGKVSDLQRQRNINSFQTDPNIQILIANVETAVGYTATSASNIIHLDYKWTPCDIDQSDDRAHRIGQTRHVNIKYLYFPNTIEEQILTLLHRKSLLMSQLLNLNSQKKSLKKTDREKLSIRKELMNWVQKIVA